ncbi:hypothetical protein Arad_4433 [Rhizobium rhizogenes K84]|uniref:Uncharacterized protein n=1 Tax=Rhizobium rhizogenes (strain K84 / ATCC BAA-868) TaxID=311403 RepID=B9JCN4_RHIR8|nr:hypothetical protein Arad_4433 [Rhizobium rhizogenes K84]
MTRGIIAILCGQTSALPRLRKIDMSNAMTRIMSKDGQFVTIFVLQDHKRLPARFFAMISGALNSRLR